MTGRWKDWFVFHQADPAPHLGVAPDVYRKGRRCRDRKLGCITILSIYNPGPWCFCCAGRHKAELVGLRSLEDDRDDERLAA